MYRDNEFQQFCYVIRYAACFYYAVQMIRSRPVSSRSFEMMSHLSDWSILMKSDITAYDEHIILFNHDTSLLISLVLRVLYVVWCLTYNSFVVDVDTLLTLYSPQWV